MFEEAQRDDGTVHAKDLLTKVVIHVHE